MSINGINTMQAIISASSAMTMVQRQGSVAASMKGREGILETEIKLDSARGGNVEKKQEELEEVQKKLTQVQTTQMDTLADANKQLEEARKEDQKAETEAKKKAEKKEKDKEVKTTEKVNNEEINETQDTNIHNVEVVTDTVNASSPETVVYPHVDIRL